MFKEPCAKGAVGTGDRAKKTAVHLTGQAQQVVENMRKWETFLGRIRSHTIFTYLFKWSFSGDG